MTYSFFMRALSQQIINSLERGTSIYLHPRDQEDIAFFGFFEKVYQEHGEQRMRLNDSLYFLYDEKKGWKEQELQELIDFPVSDLFPEDPNAKKGLYEVGVGREEILQCMKEQNIRSGFIREKLHQSSLKKTKPSK